MGKQASKNNRHPSERWKRFSTAEWLVIHFALVEPLDKFRTQRETGFNDRGPVNP